MLVRWILAALVAAMLLADVGPSCRGHAEPEQPEETEPDPPRVG